MCSALESCMIQMIDVFHKYSGTEGDKYTLNGNELKTLLNTELSGFVKNPNDKAAVEKIFKDLDRNNDQEVNFQEFAVMVVGLTIACNDFFIDMKKSKK
ncbi:protein S100-A1-like [Heterodontus francisci]|uniref:protein S100-A1-like n=1 Tax=Heterodontus francisci TaxID=7792 RepID=UPI00355B4A6D